MDMKEALDRYQKTKKESPQQKAKVKKTMGEFKKGELHSGSKHGPKVTDRSQAIAISLSQAGLSNKKKLKYKG
jgi:hypothetical protein